MSENLTPYELQEALSSYLRLIRDENYYDINAYEPSISLSEAKEMVSMIPKIKQHLENNPIKKPLPIRVRK